MAEIRSKPVFLGKEKGFAHLTLGHVRPTPFLHIDYQPTLRRSPMYISDIEKDVLEFGNDSVKPQDSSLLMAMELVREKFKLPSTVPMIHLNDVFQLDLDIWDKSPGYPWKDWGYKTKGDIRRDPDAVQRIRRFWHMIKIGKDISAPDCLAYARAHLVEHGRRKVRAVWGYPATITFGECMFAKPLIDAYKTLGEKEKPIAYGFETATGGMKRVYNRFLGDYCYSAIDFRKFDKTVPAWLIKFAFAVLAQNFDFLQYKDYGVADPDKNFLMYLYIMDYFVNTTIRISNGDRYKKKTGIASGSYFTQLIGSVCNAVLIYWICIKQTGRPPVDSLFMGDDSFFTTHRDINLREAEKLMESIGMEINDEKTQIQRDMRSIKFLGYTIGAGIPQKPFDDWMSALLCPDMAMDDLQS